MLNLFATTAPDPYDSIDAKDGASDDLRYSANAIGVKKIHASTSHCHLCIIS